MVEARKPAAGPLRLRPEWSAPETWLGALSSYLRADPRGTELTVDVSDAPVSSAVAGDLLRFACRRLGGREDAIRLRAGQAPAEGVAELDVVTPGQIRAALGIVSDLPEPVAPEALLASARWAKALCDDIRDATDAARLKAAPDPWDDPEPLVTVRIPTWRGVPGLLDQALPSVAGQTYARLEILVCSDGPDPDARSAVEGFADARVRYLELPSRPVHPSHPWFFWQVTGLRPANRALAEARGAFVCPLDHDDAFTEDHVEVLLDAARRERADLVYGQAVAAHAGRAPTLVGSTPLVEGAIAHGSVLYSSRLLHMRYDTACWLVDQPGDFNLWSRMARIGARVAFLPRVVLAHSRERTSIEHDPRGAPEAARTAADYAADVLLTDARRLLEIAPVPASG